MRRALAALLAAATILAPGLAAGASEPAPGALPVPGALAALSGDLLGFGQSELVDDCNTSPVAWESWSGFGRDAAWTYAEHNGTEVPVEELERMLYEEQGEGWRDEVERLTRKCTQGGGWCFCTQHVLGIRQVGCSVCCPAGSFPYCVCSRDYLYASCGCAQS